MFRRDDIVEYTPRGEAGVVTSVEGHVFVRSLKTMWELGISGATSQACRPTDLKLLQRDYSLRVQERNL